PIPTGGTFRSAIKRKTAGTDLRRLKEATITERRDPASNTTERKGREGRRATNFSLRPLRPLRSIVMVDWRRTYSMRFNEWRVAAMFVAAVVIGADAAQTPPAGGQGGQRAGGAPAGPAMTLKTTAFADGAPIPAKYTQAGEQ